MDFIKQWTLTISATLIISIVFSLLTPKGNMGRFFKVVLAMFIFVSFIYPIKNADFDFSLPAFDETEFEDSQQSSYENIIESYTNRIVVYAKELLSYWREQEEKRKVEEEHKRLEEERKKRN